MQTVIVCRMGSSRLPGKTLMDFGGISLLSHIVFRLGLAGVSPSDIVICSSNLPEDKPIEIESKNLGAKFFGGDPSNVSKRIIDAASYFSFPQFCLVLGDNPWVDPEQIQRLWSEVGTREYMVSPTAELPEPFPAKLFPIGTRLQLIDLNFLADRYALKRSAITDEHVSKLFFDLQGSDHVLLDDNGWSAEFVRHLNISINTKTDYILAKQILSKVGRSASIIDIVNCYQEIETWV